MKKILLFIFVMFSMLTFAQKKNIYYMGYGKERTSFVKKITVGYNVSKFNLGIDLDLDSWRDAHLKNYKVVLGYGKHNVEDFSLIPYIILGYRCMGDEYSVKSFEKKYKYNNYYTGLGAALYRNFDRFNFGFNASVTTFKHKLEFGDSELKDENKLDYTLSIYAAYNVSSNILVFSEITYNHYNFMIFNNKKKHGYFIGSGVAFKL